MIQVWVLPKNREGVRRGTLFSATVLEELDASDPSLMLGKKVHNGYGVVAFIDDGSFGVVPLSRLTTKRPQEADEAAR